MNKKMHWSKAHTQELVAMLQALKNVAMDAFPGLVLIGLIALGTRILMALAGGM